MSVVNGKRQAAWFDLEAEPSAPARPGGGTFAGVVFNRPLDQVFSYRVPDRLASDLQVGQRVKVPLGRGNKAEVGYCVRVDATLPEGIEPAKVKELTEILDNPPLIDSAMLTLTRW